ncbi:MAG: (2Fe-2S)-binding protein [Dehalococcoidia bacterium]|nr:(2Fe-2S)-binding protein [Dehalococcoidia bacterium]
MRTLELTVNGREDRLDVADNTTLSQLLRDHLGLTGTKVACDRGECGACTVLVDGMPLLACSVLAHTIPGSSVVTVEGLAGDSGELTELQQAFLDVDAVQCGFCTPGFLMMGTYLLSRSPRLDREAILAGLKGNLCRCGCYNQIVTAMCQTSESGIAVP